MISPVQARTLIRKNAISAKITKVKLSDCLGLVLAENMRAPFAMPLADNSAMDGFVLRAVDTISATRKQPLALKISGVIKAGDKVSARLRAGTAWKIMTGGFLPQGADTVLPKEQAQCRGKQLILQQPVAAGRHVRRKGEEVRPGQIILKKGMLLDPAAVGVLAAFGYDRILVYARPRVAVLATGNELLAPGKKLSAGKIYDSNSWMIRAALLRLGIQPDFILRLRDSLSIVRKGIRQAMARCDYLILLGGVSAGDYDVVKQALQQEGVQTVFWKVRQKPGKPLYLGKKKNKLIFGLPGNPAAAWTCFYEYVYPALAQTCGLRAPEMRSLKVRVEGKISPDPEKHLFLKARLLEGTERDGCLAQVLPHQGSHMLSSLIQAQGFLHIPPSKNAGGVARLWDFHCIPGAGS